MLTVTGISIDEYLEIRKKGVESSLIIWGQLRGGFAFDGDFYYIGKYCYKVSSL